MKFIKVKISTNLIPEELPAGQVDSFLRSVDPLASDHRIAIVVPENQYYSNFFKQLPYLNILSIRMMWGGPLGASSVLCT